MKRYTRCLTIAGSDSGGGAGIQADLKTMSALGVYGMSVITAITAQNSCGVRAIQPVDAAVVRAQLEAVMEDIGTDAVKIGMLFNGDIVREVALFLDKYRSDRVVLDPVMVATSRDKLICDETVSLFREALFPRIALLTPNREEAERLSGVTIETETDVYRAAEQLLNRGCRAVLMKGGHLPGDRATDWLFRTDRSPRSFSAPRVETPNTHGTGCTLSSAIAALLASGKPLEEAVESAKQYLSKALAAGAGVRTGHGHGPLNHFFDPTPLILS